MLLCDEQGTLHITNFEQPYAQIVVALGAPWEQMYDLEHIRGPLLRDDSED